MSFYDELKQSNGDLKILSTLIQAVHKSSDLEEIYRVALYSVIELENVDLAMIYLIDEEKREAVLKAHINVTEDYTRRAGTIPYPKGITWKVINSGRIINIEDAQKDPGTGSAGKELGHHSNLGIPIFLEERVVGVIWFGSYKERRFDEREVNLLSALGDQIAIAIAKAKMFEEIKQREEALRCSEERYRAIVEDQTELICRFLPDGTLTFVNESYCRYFAKKREELIGRSVMPLITDEDQERCKNHIVSFNQEHTVATIEHRVLMPSGEVRWQQWTDRAIFDQEGHIVEFQSVGRDITAHKRAEKELHQKNELLKLLQVITTAANSASTLEVTMQTALDEVCAYTGSPVGHVYLTDSTGELIPTAIWHLENPERFGTLRKVTEATRFTPGVGLPGRILASRNPAWITDVTDDPNFLRAKQTKDIGVKTSFGFPVLIGTEVVAVLEFFSPEVIEPDNSLLEVITQISTQLGRVFERKRADEEIQQVNARTESVLDSVADTHILFDRDWRYLYVNQAAVRAIGRQREQILGRTLWELYPDIVGTELERQYHRAMDERLTIAFDFHYPPLDTWWENRFYAAPEGLAVFATNITERKLAEKALMETLDHLSKKNRYETIISTVTRNVHQSINLQDVLENAVEAMNKNIDRVDKVSIYLVEGEEAVLMAHRGYTDQYIKRAGRISYPRGTTWKTIIEGKPRYVADADRDAVIGPAGREMGTKSYASMPIHFEGKAVGVININSLQKNAFDEEELKLLKIIAQQIEIAINNAQQAELLRESEERFRRIFEEGPLGMAVTGWDYRFIQVNARLCQMLGYTEQELLGLTFTEVTHPEDISKDVRFVQQMFRGEIPYYRVEKRYIKKNKEIIWCNLTTAAIHDKDGKCPYNLKMIEDITEHKRAEETLQEYAERSQYLSQKLLEAQETERHHVARELHDEVGQVLTVVKINLQKIRRSNKNRTLAPHLEESIAIIDKATEQVRNLSLDLRPSMLDDLGLIATLRWYIDRQAQQAGFVAELVTDLRAYLHPDLETVCFRIVQEALTNVVRHAQAQRVHIRLRQRNGELELVIRDNGVGFDARVAQKRAAHGASFGLLGMQERTQLVSGQIEIRSEPKRGTTIRVRFPLIPSLSRIR